MLSLCFLVIVLYTSVVVASSTVGNREKLKKVGKAGNVLFVCLLELILIHCLFLLSLPQSAVANKLGPLLNSRTAGKNLIYSPTSIWSGTCGWRTTAMGRREKLVVVKERWTAWSGWKKWKFWKKWNVKQQSSFCLNGGMGVKNTLGKVMEWIRANEDVLKIF